MPFDQNNLPEWNVEGVEPPQSKKDSGWGPGEKPPADWFNWFFSKTYNALKSLFDNAQHKEEKGQPGGYAALDENGKVINADGTYPGGVQSVNGKTGNVNLTASDVGAISQEDFDAHLADYVNHPGYGVATGSANAYEVTLNPAPTAYVEGMAIAVKINVDNTGPSTINVNGLGVKAIKKPNGNDVSAGNLKAGSIYTLRYNGTNFILQGEGGSGNAQPSQVLSGRTFTNDAGEQVGTMPNRSAENFHMPALETAVWEGDKIFLRPPQGYYDGNSWVTASEPNLVAANIRQGVNIFGVTGSFDGKRWASGTVTAKNKRFDYLINGTVLNDQLISAVEVYANFGFTPSIIVVHQNSGVPYFSVYSAHIINSEYKIYFMDSYPHLCMAKLTRDAFVNANGFCLPVWGYTTYKWFAFE